MRHPQIVRTTLRTVRQLVARTPCPYRGLDDFHSFVRRREMVQTRMRTPHPSAFGCHLPPLGKAFDKCEHRLKPKDSANITREEQAPPLPRSRETVRLCVSERKYKQRYGRFVNRPYKRNFSKRRRGRRPRRPEKNTRREQTLWRRTKSPHLL